MNDKFHTFRGSSLEDAFRAMRGKLGEGAVVVRTTTVRDNGLMGLLGRKVYELTASAPSTPQPRRLSPVEKRYTATKTGSDENIRETVTYFRQIVADAQQRMGVKLSSPAPSPAAPRPAMPAAPPRASAPSPAPAPTPAAPRVAPTSVVAFPRAKDGDSPESLRRELREMRGLIETLIAESPGSGLPPEFAPHYRMLLEQGVARPLAASLIGSLVRGSDLSVLRDRGRLLARLHEEVQCRFRVSGGLRAEEGKTQVVALVGPTGVGKTTNVAKLAAHFAVRQRRKVALITADTYRVAAPEQLRTYANIIGLPLEVVNSPREMSAAVKKFRGVDFVFIDTAGGSPFNGKQLYELKEVVEAARTDEVMLVASANTPLEDLRAVVQNFRILEPTSLYFTKLDETRRFGALISLLAEAQLPLGYLSIGQNVPEDLAVAQPAAVAGLIVKGGESRGTSSSKSA